MDKKISIIYAFLAAIFYAISMPFSKILLEKIPSISMAGLLYIGAGIGVSFIYLFKYKKEKKEYKLSKEDLKYIVGMILLDIIAPILLMIGIKNSSISSASLLSNFEIVATTLIALLIFKEKIDKNLWVGIIFILIASIVLSIDQSSNFNFSLGSIFIIMATICWGFENNCTRKISSKSTYQIVILKGIFSGIGSILIGIIIGEKIHFESYILLAMVLGFVSYGLSIFLYVRAQNKLGAAKTSAYYAVSPFIGSFLSFILLKEEVKSNYIIGLIFVIIGSIFVIVDTLIKSHAHMHKHELVHSHDGIIHTHIIEHSHTHSHIKNKHNHHSKKELESMLTKNDK